jgi:DNA (cytosine-5)-methyltransferase 1
MKHIELFAGCGGLSLGLESEGFDLLFANELSPMAGETFAYNHLGLNLSENGIGSEDPVYWINSQFRRDEAEARLKENPYNTAAPQKPICDLENIEKNPEKLRSSLLIGSILDLNILIKKPKVKAALKKGLGAGQVELVSGGPPCQSFSLAGMRQHSNERNSLPWAFAEFVRQVKPKMALLENVSGILRPFVVNGKKHHAWYEVAKAFAVEGYVPLCLHVNAKYVGAAQNRPRFIMLAFQKDVFKRIQKNNSDQNLGEALANSNSFFTFVKSIGENLEYGHLNYYDVGDGNISLFDSPIFAPLVKHRSENRKSSKLVLTKHAIDDLNGPGRKASDYVKDINNLHFKNTEASKLRSEDLENFVKANNFPENQEHRRNNDRVRARFRLYQVMNKLESIDVRNEIKAYLRSGDPSVITKRTLKELAACDWLLTADGAVVSGLTPTRMLNLLQPLQTKKQTQRALEASKPAPAALSIPDDACHYDENTQRTLTVRELARFQSFPDWFVFRSKVTTGGQMRKYQVPQYTQVGNAVPPLLGKALGKVCKEMLALAD